MWIIAGYELVDEDKRGRVMGFYSFMVVGLAPFGSFQMGWMAEHFGARTAFIVGGSACAVVALLAWSRLTERLRELVLTRGWTGDRPA